MRILHTADWHLGRVLKGRERTEEVREALHRLLELVSSERVELVLVAGDIFDRSVVSTEAEAAAFEFFVRLRELGVPALVIAGNHDNQERLEALAPLLALTGATARGRLRFAEEGGTVEVRGARVALLPFLSERRLVRVEHLRQGREVWKGAYGEGMRKIIANLTQGSGGGLFLLMAHLAVEGGRLGGGEFVFHTTNSYVLLPQHLPQHLTYVALGHLHQQQQVCEAPVAWYPGSLIQLDFGEHEESPRGALMVEVEAGKPPIVHPINERWGRPLKTFRFPLEELDRRWEEVRRFPGYSKVVIRGRGSPSLRERLFREQERLLEVEFELPEAPSLPSQEPAPGLPDWTEIYAAYHQEQNGQEAPPELLRAFREVLEESLQPSRI
ncbi:exonuclease SbcCD subunit D [Meiothermus sp. QL-1]|uniref:metallophosphoesterase family protein n=1 Tax=Meiothermus sp. QL-1 TaxID=2058095 RepID=UPI000E0B0116|nr:exonuclease SbcCD subunit D [Meiothermus sp. QL-1]RDI95698.1 exonuclease SbcCD subunit D [Meiothermus sp. QL-1]